MTIKKITETSPSSGNPLQIALSVPSELSNTTTTVTVKITSASKIKRVVYKKNGSINAAALLADEEATTASESANNNALWTFDVDENAIYTVAAIDEAGREETAQIHIQTIDKIPPAEVTNISSSYDSSLHTVQLKWTDPADTTDKYDSPFAHVVITYTIDNESEAYTVEQTIAKGTQFALISDVNTDERAESYLFTVHTVDELGNISKGAPIRQYVIIATASDVVPKIKAMTYTGTVKVTGEITTNLLSDIKDAINSLADGIYVGLDLSEATGLTSFYSATNLTLGQFYNCTKLQSIILPDVLRYISNYAFYGCTGLTTITIPDGVTTIGENAFYGCTNLESVIIPNSVETIKTSAFGICKSLASVTIGNSVTSIGKYAFSSCESLVSVTFKDTKSYWRGKSQKINESDLSVGTMSATDTAANAKKLTSEYVSRDLYIKK